MVKYTLHIIPQHSMTLMAHNKDTVNETQFSNNYYEINTKHENSVDNVAVV